MGADFVCAVVPIAVPREEAHARLALLTDDQIIDRMRHGHYDPEFYDEYYKFDENGEVVGVNRDVFLPVLADAINTTYNVAEGRHRYGSFLQFGEATFAMVGEMSYGDVPEYFDDLCVVHDLCVTYDTNKTLKWVEA